MRKETNTPEDRVRRAVKSIDFTIARVEGTLAATGGNFDVTARVRDCPEQVRVVARARWPRPERWAVAILLNNQRIDGIDWELSVKDHRGKKHNCTGWHRHIWTPSAQDTLKECLPDFKAGNLREFLENSFRILNVQLKKGGYGGDSQLSFDQTHGG
jgi:hypothetical protein